MQAAIAPIAVVDAAAAGSGASTLPTATIATVAVAAVIVLGVVAVITKTRMSARSALPFDGHNGATQLVWDDEMDIKVLDAETSLTSSLEL